MLLATPSSATSDPTDPGTIRRPVRLINSMIKTIGLNFWCWDCLPKSRKCGHHFLVEGGHQCDAESGRCVVGSGRPARDCSIEAGGGGGSHQWLWGEGLPGPGPALAVYGGWGGELEWAPGDHGGRAALRGGCRELGKAPVSLKAPGARVQCHAALPSPAGPGN